MGRNELIDRYAAIAHPWLMRYMEPKRHCIAATWVTIAVMKKLNISAEPLAVKLRAINAKLMDAMQRTEHEVVDWQVEMERGAWEVQIGYNSPEEMAALPNLWNGHLVAYVPSRGVLIDASLSQVSRPEKELRLVDVGIFAVGKRMPGPGDAYSFVGPGGEVLQYIGIDDELWRKQRDWTRGELRYRECVAGIVAELTRGK